jgi:predicted peroxiredoxin
MKKVALLAYNGEPTCFAHVMLYALDFHAKGYEVRVVIEGSATRLITDLATRVRHLQICTLNFARTT